MIRSEDFRHCRDCLFLDAINAWPRIPTPECDGHMALRPDTPLAHSFCSADGSPNNQQLSQYGFFIVGEKQSHCCSISIAPECAWYPIVFFRQYAPVAIIAADSKRSFWAAWTVMKNCRLAMCPAGRERDPSDCQASDLTPEPPVLQVLVPGGCNVNHIVFDISSITLGSFVFARCGRYEKAALDFIRACHRIVQSTLLISFFDAPEAYMRERLSDGYIANNTDRK